MKVPAINGFIEVSKLLKGSNFWLIDGACLFFILNAEVLKGLSSTSFKNFSYVS